MRIILFITTFVVFISVFYAQDEIGINHKRDSPFYVNYENDLAILRNSLSLFKSMKFRKSSNDFNPLTFKTSTTKSVDDINSLDQLAVLPYDDKMSEMSDILQYGLISAAASLLINKDMDDMATIAIMYSQSLLTINSLAKFTKVSFDRYRPYNFHYEDGLEHRAETNPRNSFFSAHTATAFTNASFITTVFSAYNSESPWKYVVGASSFGVATTIGVLRITSGNHFISDVMVGAALGSFIGWFIPHIHKKKSYDGPELQLTINEHDDLGIQFAFSLD